jgi:hypothetical protein
MTADWLARLSSPLAEQHFRETLANIGEYPAEALSLASGIRFQKHSAALAVFIDIIKRFSRE